MAKTKKVAEQAAANEPEEQVDQEVTPILDAVPSFTLRADKPRHIHALIAAATELQDPEAIAMVREFELFLDRSR